MRHYLRFCVYFIVLLALLQLPPHAQSKTLLQTNTSSFVLADTFGLGTFSDAEVSPDGNFLATAGTRGVWLFRTDNFSEPIAFFEVAGGIWHVAFDPTGNFLAGYALDGHIWNITSGEELLSLYQREPHDASVNFGEKIVENLAFNSDGTLVAIETHDGVDVWSILNQDLVYEQNDQALVGFQSDKLLVSQYQDTGLLISIINISSWITENSFALPSQTADIRLSPDTQIILAANFPVTDSAQGFLGTNEGDLHILSATTGDDIATTSHHAIYNPHVAFNSGHSQIAFNTSEAPYIPGYIGEIQLWDFNSDEILTIPGYDSPITTLAISPDGLLLVTGQERGFESHQSVLRVWDTSSGENVATSPALAESAVEVNFSPDGSFIYSIHSDGILRIWNPQTADMITAIGHGTVLADLSIPSSRIVTANSGGEISVWQVDISNGTYQLVASIQLDPISPIRAVALSTSGNLVAFTTGYIYDRENVITDSIQVWNVDTAQVEIIFEDLSQQVNQIAISPDEQVLAVAFTDAMQASLRFDQQSIHLWDLDTLQPLDTPLVGHSSYITSLRFSGDSRLLASGGCGDRDVEGTCDTGELFIWELVTGEPVVGPIHEHTSAIYGLAFDPTGKKLASGSGGPIFYGSTSDYSIALWDTASGEAVSLPLLAAYDYEDALMPGPIYALDFSPNDHLLLSATRDSVFAYDSVIRLWDTSTREQIQTLNAYSAGIIDAGFTQNGNHIVSISEDGTVRIWERAN